MLAEGGIHRHLHLSRIRDTQAVSQEIRKDGLQAQIAGEVVPTRGNRREAAIRCNNSWRTDGIRLRGVENVPME